MMKVQLAIAGGLLCFGIALGAGQGPDDGGCDSADQQCHSDAVGLLQSKFQTTQTTQMEAESQAEADFDQMHTQDPDDTIVDTLLQDEGETPLPEQQAEVDIDQEEPEDPNLTSIDCGDIETNSTCHAAGCTWRGGMCEIDDEPSALLLEAAASTWEVKMPATTLTGPAINHNTPLPVTVKLDLGGNIWIVGLVDGAYLKMVKIEITGSTTFTWITTRYDNGYSSACASPTSFTADCFKGANPSSNSYPVNLQAEQAGACSWSTHTGKYSGGYAGGVSTGFSTENAKSKCIELGKDVCKAITCTSGGTCTVRASSSLGTSSSGETTYVPACEAENQPAPKDGYHKECWTSGGCKDDGKNMCNWCGQHGNQLMYCCNARTNYAPGHACHKAQFKHGEAGHHCVTRASADGTGPAPTPAPTQATYTQTEYGHTCPSRSSAIVEEAACKKAAAALGKLHWRGTNHNKGWGAIQFGCFTQGSKTWFNKLKGTTNKNYANICYSSAPVATTTPPSTRAPTPAAPETPVRPAPVSPTTPEAPADNWIKTDKQLYAVGEPIRISFSREQLPISNLLQSRAHFAGDWIGAFLPYIITPGLILNDERKFLIQAPSMITKTCGSWDCSSAPSNGTIVWSSAGTQRENVWPHGSNQKSKWPLGSGCYKLGLIGYSEGRRQIMATSDLFGIGPEGMTLCKLPRTWQWHPASEGSQAEIANIGSGNGFRVTARRFPMEVPPWTPLGEPFQQTGSTHPDTGQLKMRPCYPFKKWCAAWKYGPGTHMGNYGQQRRFYAGVRSSDGREGVIWKDTSTSGGTSPQPRGRGILATWLSADMASAQTQTLITDPAALLGAAAFNADGSQVILFLWWHGKTMKDSGIAKFVKIDCATGKTLIESEAMNAGAKLGIARFGKEKTIASMEWNSEEDVIGFILSGDYAGGHFGSCSALLDSATMTLIYAGGKGASHSLSTSMIKADDGSFLVEEIGDNYPRGIQVQRLYDVEAKRRQRKYRPLAVLPYTFKTHMRPNAKSSNDNGVYTEIAYPGVVEVADGLMVFFSGERPALDNSKTGEVLNAPRNLGFVKISKDLTNLLVMSKGITETGYFMDFGGQRRDQKIEGINYLTNFKSKETSASRVKTARLEDGKILLYWEVWSADRYAYAQLMVVNDEGAPLAGPWIIDSPVALPQPDYLLVKSGREAVGYAGQCDVEWTKPSKRKGKAKTKQCYLVRYTFQWEF